MIFLVGARRSGTNWLERVLTAHPDLSAIRGETYLFTHGIQPLSERFHHGARNAPEIGKIWMERDAFLDALRDFCDAVFEPHMPSGGHTRLVERTPWHVRTLRLMSDVYPDAWFVNLVRDGRDVARSLLSMDWGPRDMRTAAAEWKEAVEGWEAAQPFLQRAITVRYEEAMADIDGTTERLYRELSLSAEPDDLAAARAEAARAFNVDTRAPSIETGKWRTSLSERDLADFMSVAGDTLVAAGYEAAGYEAATATGRAAPSRSGPWPDLGSLRARLGSVAREGRRGGGRRGAGRRSEAEPDPAALARDVTGRNIAGIELVNELLSRLIPPRPEVEALLAPDVLVRAVTPTEEWSARGPEAVARLTALLSADAALAGHQSRGDIFSGVPTLTVLLGYTNGDTVSHRLLAVTTNGEVVTGAEWYRLD